MKIIDILQTFESNYSIRRGSGMSFFSYLFEVFGISDENHCEDLNTISVKLKKLIEVQPSLSVYREAELVSDITNMLCSVIERLHMNGIARALNYIALFTDPETLLGAKESLTTILQQTTPELIGIFKEMVSLEPALDYEPVIRFDGGRIIKSSAILPGANLEGVRRYGIGYCTSLADAKEASPNYSLKKKPYPILLTSDNTNAFAAALGSAESLKALTVPLTLPVIRI